MAFRKSVEEKKEQEDLQELFPPHKIFLNLTEGLKKKIVYLSQEKHYLIRSEGDLYVVQSKGIGSGSFGSVNKGWELSESDTEEKFDFLPYAFKFAPTYDDETKEAVELERKALNALLDKDAKTIQIENTTILIMKYLPGEQLISDAGILHPAIAKLPLVQKLDLVIAILDQLNSVHQKGWAHGDIKGQNILFILDEKTNKPTVYFTDYGLSRDVSTGPAPVFSPGSPGHLAPERVKEQILTTQSDIYSITTDVMLLLGVSNPLEDKLAEKTLPKDSVKAIENIFSQLNPAISKNAKEMLAKPVIDMLARMKDTDMRTRPTAAEASAFFKGFREFCDAYQRDKTKKSFFTSKEKHDKQLITSFLKEHADSTYVKKLAPHK